MVDLMTVVKEAKSEVIKVLEPFFQDSMAGGQFNFDADHFKELSVEVNSILKPFHEKVNDKISLSDFVNLIILDMQFNFIGGAILKEGENTEIEIKS